MSAVCYLYVDPGSGSYLVQAIIAAALGAAFYFKNIWFRIKTFFGGRRHNRQNESDDRHE